MGRFSNVRLALMVVAVTAAGCAYERGDDPITRRLTWFSYMNGDDLRADCRPGGPRQFRLVYNGIYARQVRTYDLAPTPSGLSYTLTVRVTQPLTISPIITEETIARLFRDPFGTLLAPGRGTIMEVSLTPEDVDRLEAALDASGFFYPAPRGLRLRSEDFFWTGVVCRDGTITFQAYRWRSPAFDRIEFANVLFQWDPTGIPVEPPRLLSDREIFGDPRQERGTRFSVTVGDNGLAGIRTLF